MVARWGKLESLVTADPAYWLFQVSRMAGGELPYRDFSWNYPPLAIFLMGGFLKVFGVRFEVAQIAINFLSLAVVGLCYGLIRHILPRSLHFATITLVVCIGATAQTKFNLFSFLAYSPSLHLGAIGLLLVMIGGLRYLRSGVLGRHHGLHIAAGLFIAAVSKPEALAAALALLVVLAFADRRLWCYGRPLSAWMIRHGALAAAGILPAAAAYAWIAGMVGGANLAAGVGGYGLASFACPWWPTGLGVFGGLAAAGQAAAVAAILSLPLRRRFVERFGNRYGLLWKLAAPGVVVYVGYLWYLNRQMLASSAAPLQKIKSMLPTLLWTSPVLLPVMWASIAIWGFLLWRWCWPRGRSVNRETLELVFLLTAPVLLSFRGVFGTTLFPYTEVSAICYPFFALLGPYLLWQWLNAGAAAASGESRWKARLPVAIVSTVALAYSLVRCIGAYPVLFSDRPYQPLLTEAGWVKLSDNGASAEIYRFAVAHTQPGDLVLEIPYGGGINFAARRSSPLFTTQFQQLRMPERYLRQDLRQIQARPPKVVIADNQPRFGATYGYRAAMGCPFPYLLWEPNRPSWDPSVALPAVNYIENHYRVAAQVTNKLLLVRADSQDQAGSKSHNGR